jgi:diguanylate cyclase (GGDEF)-like protein/PAS domain S-box-containing protein
MASPDRSAFVRLDAALVDAVQVGLVVIGRDDRIIRVNPAFCVWTGFEPAVLVGERPPYPFCPAGEQRTCFERRWREVRAGASGYFEVTVAHRDGRLLEAAVAGAPVHDCDGRVVGYVATYRDMSAVQAQVRLERALSDLAAAVADPGALFDRIAVCLAELFGAPSAAVVRFENNHGIIVGAHAHPSVPVPGELRLSEPSATATVASTGRPAREEYATAESEFARRARAAGLRSAVAVPVRLDSTLWGCLGVISDQPGGLPDDTEQRLGRVADLVSVALSSAEARSQLHRQATTDGLTGLLNHRAFYERLGSERRRAIRHRRQLALILFDIDRFKAVNATRGHQAGDRVLQTVAQAFAKQARAGDVLARLGGDELAVIAPDTDTDTALSLAERLRACAAHALAEAGLPLTLSSGVTDFSAAETVDGLVRSADRALYQAKRQGRNDTVRYTPDAAEEPSYKLTLRGRMRTAVQAMTRAIVAKDGSTREHAEQVACVAEQVAGALGWNAERCARLREAALLHDVGTLALPDAILHKDSEFTPEEYQQVKTHAAIGAHMTEGLLDDEQVRWVRSHHERPDGGGYPGGLAGQDIPDGARVLAVADAYDAITSPRSHKLQMRPADAVAELRRCAHSQFDPAAVDALADYVAAGGYAH